MQKQTQYQAGSSTPFSYGLGNPSGAAPVNTNLPKASAVVPPSPSLVKQYENPNPARAPAPAQAAAPAPAPAPVSSAWINPSDLWGGDSTPAPAPAPAPAPVSGRQSAAPPASSLQGVWFNPADLGFSQVCSFFIVE